MEITMLLVNTTLSNFVFTARNVDKKAIYLFFFARCSSITANNCPNLFRLKYFICFAGPLLDLIHYERSGIKRSFAV